MRQLHLFCAIEIHPEMQIFLYYMLNSKKRAAGRNYIFLSATRFALSCYTYTLQRPNNKPIIHEELQSAYRSDFP